MWIKNTYKLFNLQLGCFRPAARSAEYAPTIKMMNMDADVMYALIQWEDQFTSVINTQTILKPKRGRFQYTEGEEISSHFQNKVYEAIICELHRK